MLRPGLAAGHARVHRRDLPARDSDEDMTEVHADLAAALQERTEQVMVHLARRARAVTGSRRLCVGGGVAMNCVGIGKIIDDGLFEEVYVPPAPGDSGTAIGAALAAYRGLPPESLPDGPAAVVLPRPRLPGLHAAAGPAGPGRAAGRRARPGSLRRSSLRVRSRACSRAGWRPGRGRWVTGRSSPPRSCRTSPAG